MGNLQKEGTKHITAEAAKEFLTRYHRSPVGEFVHIREGKHSDAFSYTHKDQKYIARFNRTDEGFLKDQYAFEHLSAPRVVIPRIIATGSYDAGVFFCISEKAEGETVKEQYVKNDFSSLPLQFETVEAIKNIAIESSDNSFGKWTAGGHAHRKYDEYFYDICNGGLSDWNIFGDVGYFDDEFVEYLRSQTRKYSSYTAGARELVHGDFGSSNLFVRNGQVSGIIDWAHSFYGDHFWDIGRIVLFCPNRKATTEAAIRFYHDKAYADYKKRIAWGVYAVMLKNYRAALETDNETSCLSAPERIKEFETYAEL